jgi:hypothetical protein
MKLILLIFAFLSGAGAQVNLRTPLPPATSPIGYREGDWCAMPVFTRVSPTVLVFTQDASPSRPCYLHALGVPLNGVESMAVFQWMSAATITITPGVVFDDVVYFYWSGAVLHISSVTPRFTCDAACVVDPVRTSDVLPAGVLVGGLYNVVAGEWAMSGHSIINEHQILTQDTNTVTYLPNAGYLFTMVSAAPPPPAPATASHALLAATLSSAAVEEIQVERQRAVQDITKVSAEADSKTLKGLRDEVKALESKRALPAQTQLQALKDTLGRLQAQADILAAKYANNREQQQMAQQQVVDRLLMRSFQFTIPPAPGSQCTSHLVAVDKDNLYICSEDVGRWKFIPLKDWLQ